MGEGIEEEGRGRKEEKIEKKWRMGVKRRKKRDKWRKKEGRKAVWKREGVEYVNGGRTKEGEVKKREGKKRGMKTKGKREGEGHVRG